MLQLNDELEMSKKFREGISISELMISYNLGRKRITRILHENLKDEYKICAKRIISLSGKKSATKLRGRKQNRTKEWNKKIGDAQRGRKLSQEQINKIRETWKKIRLSKTPEEIKNIYNKIVETKRKNGYFTLHSKRHSEWMKINCPNKNKLASSKTKQKMREAKLRFFANGGIPSQQGTIRTSEQCKAISVRTKKMWENGKFKKHGLWRSKLEISIYDEFIKYDLNTKHSVSLTSTNKTYVYDIFVPSLNLMIEVNGDYWHLNPKIYNENFFDKYRNIKALEIWDRDHQKIKCAENHNFKTKIIWQNEIRNIGVSQIVQQVFEDFTFNNLITLE